MIINLKALEELGYTVQIDEEAMQVDVSVGGGTDRGLGRLVRDCATDIKNHRGWTERQADNLYNDIADNIMKTDISTIIS